MNNNDYAFYQDPYLDSIEVRIKSVLNQELAGVVLENTICYPTGGGQPGDSGTLLLADGQTLMITNTRRCRETGQIIHELETVEGLNSGDVVTIHLDWERRYAHMRMHTCLHLLSAVIRQPVTGGGLTDKKGRLDFAISGELPDKQELSKQLNDLIAQSFPVNIEMLNESVLDEQPELVKTMSVQPPRGTGTLRMIRVGEVDFQPCGGTHVRNTSEISRVTVSKVESKGKQNKRIHIVFS